MAKAWSDVAASEGFKALPPDEQDGARRQYFESVVAPQVPEPEREAAWGQFSSATGMGRRELPASVAPSNAGGGRGSVNPGMSLANAQPSRAQRIAEMNDATDPASAAFVAPAKPRSSVLEGVTMSQQPFDAQEAERLSNRAYAERTPIPGTPRRELPSLRPSTGPAPIPRATSLGESLQDSSLPVRAGAKAYAGIVQGVGGAVRAVGDVTGLDGLARGGAETAKQAEQFQQGMGTSGPVEGFGPKSPVPYLADMAEGATSSLAQSAALAAAFGPAAVIPLMSVQTAGQEYDKARQKGLSPAASLAGAIPKGIFEAVGEKFTGLDKVAGAMGTLLQKGASEAAKRTAGETLIRSGIREIPGEMLTYLGQTGVDLLPGIGLNPDLTMRDFLDGMRDTVVQAGMMGGAMGGTGTVTRARTEPQAPAVSAEAMAKSKGFLVREGQIKQLRDAGEAGAADLLQQRHDRATAAESVDGELERLPGNPVFQDGYRQLRASGIKPAEAAARSAVTASFQGLSATAGIPEKAAAAAMEKASSLPLDQVPGFLSKFTAALAKRGLVQPFDGMDGMAAGLEAARDEALDAAMGAMYQPAPEVKQAMDDVLALEAAQDQPQGAFDAGQPADLAAPDASPAPADAAPELPSADGALPGALDAAQPAPGAVEAQAVTAEADGQAPTQRPPASWVIREKATGAVIAETFDEKKAAALNTQKYEAVPIVEHLSSLSSRSEAQPSPLQPTAAPPLEVDAAPADVPTPALPAGPVQLGRNNQPLTDGGKPFKTRLAASEAKKLQPMMRVVSVQGGFALTEKTEKQLAAEAKAARRLRNPQTSAPGEPIPAHAFIASEGGLHADTRADMNIGNNPRIGNRNLFAGKGKGLSMERATARLIEEGYLGEGASQNDAAALIQRSLSQPQYNADGIERIAQTEEEARYAAYELEMEEAASEVQALDDGEFDLLDDSSIPWDDAPSNTSTEAAMRALGFTQEEIDDAIAQESGISPADRQGADSADAAAAGQAQAGDERRAPAQGQDEGLSDAEQIADAVEYADNLGLTGAERREAILSDLAGAWGMMPDEVQDVPAVKAALRKKPSKKAKAIATDRFVEGVKRQAIEANRRMEDRANAADKSTSGVQSSPSGESLISPTQQDVLDQQARAEAADKAEKAQQRAADEIARRERIRKDIAKASEAAADSFELGGDAEQNLSGQGSMFDEPVPKAERPSAAELRARADLNNALADLGDIFSKPFKAHITPEQEQKLLPVLTRVLDAAFRLGYAKFKDSAKFALDQIKDALGADVADALTLDHLQGAYIAMAGGKAGADTKRAVIDIEDKSEIEGHAAKTDNERNEESNAPSTDGRVERDSAKPATEPAMGDAVSAEPGADAAGARQDGGPASAEARRGQQDRPSVPFGSAPVARERGDQPVSAGNPAPELEGILAGSDFREPGGDSGLSGVPPEPIPASEVVAVADKDAPGLKTATEILHAERSPIKPGDIDNIRATLPQLLPGQQDDVQLAEKRFSNPKGYGMLFTNGTGTGKTFSGLGVVKRFARQGKANTLVVTPDDKIAADWIESGKLLGLGITKLTDTKDAGKGIVITTYANLGENDALARRQWDLVVADEAHTLMQAADGKPTGYLESLRAITHHPDGAVTRYTMLNRKDIDRAAEIGRDILNAERDIAAQDTTEMRRAALQIEREKLQTAMAAINQKLGTALKAVQGEVKAAQGEKRARLVALSATPFAYEKTIDWAQGYLFEYKDGYPFDEQRAGLNYNQPSPREYFMQTRFGYSMRYNKLTTPDGKVDSGMMQRQFNGELKKSGSLSGRMLDVKPDYDRRFVLVNSAIGNRIDEALAWLADQQRAAARDNPGFSDLSAAINEKFKYLEKRYLLEAIKATEVIPIVKQHMAMGRKVVVFHDYKKGGGFNPFQVASRPSSGFAEALSAFNAKFSDLVSAALGSMPSPIDVFTRELPGTLLINGDEKKADLLARYKSFQDDTTGPQVMLVQSAKNKGWSGHDTTGKHQRVLINLGQPTAPTLAIQQEGRIYRTGQASDAIMRYLNTGTNWERWAFASTIATRASTAENLGMGEAARALKDSFIQSFEESDAYPPGHEGEGKGGKERDKAANNALTEYDRAKSLYFANQKKTSRTKAQEGADYFATPEPVGLKMVEWLDARNGESLLEPSGGHGAIARWFPEKAEKTVIEPSLALRSRLALAMNAAEDRIIDGTFEDHAIVNKYDGIAMNPPFGTAGRTAVDHIAKAATHLRDGGRIVALLPVGSADAKFDKWFYESSEKAVKPLAKHPTLGDVFKGDTLSIRGYEDVAWVVESAKNGFVQIKTKNGAATSEPLGDRIAAIKPTGKRTEAYRPTADLYLVASIKLPSSTFERAGTAVNTRIVVIEKQADKAFAPANGLRDMDLTSIESTKELFDRLENIVMPKRPKVDAVEPEAPAQTKNPGNQTKPAKTAPALLQLGDTVMLEGKPYEVATYTTNAGKELRGVWVPTQAQALQYGASTFQKRPLGWFVRERDLPAQQGPALARNPEAARRTQPADANLTAIQKTVNELSAKWQNGPALKVVAKPSDLPIPAPSDARGLIHKGTAYIVASNNLTRDAVARTLGHEAVGHYGLWRILGDEGTKRFSRNVQLALKSGNVPLNKIAEKVRRLYVDDKGNFNLSAKQESDEIAAFAVEDAIDPKTGEFKPGYGFVKEVYAKVAAWLRDTLGLKIPFTMAELHGMLVSAMRGLEAGKRLSGGGQSVAAFGRDANQTETPSFKVWFDKSLVREPMTSSKQKLQDMPPKVVYHGTRADFEAFDPVRQGNISTTFGGDSQVTRHGMFFAENPGFANTFATQDGEGAPKVLPVYLSIKNPIYFDESIADPGGQLDELMASGLAKSDAQAIKNISQKWAAFDDELGERLIAAARKAGFDGAYMQEEGVGLGDDADTQDVWVAFSPTQVKSAIGNNGNFDPKDGRIAFARSIPTPGPGLFQPNTWSAPEPTRLDKILYEVQDGKIDLRRVQQAIVKSGQQIEEKWDARLAETLYPGRVAHRSQTFLELEAKPLLEAMTRNNVAMPELADYLHARGAEERNVQIAKVNPKMPDGGAGTNSEGTLLTTQAARAYLANIRPARKVVLDAMARRVDAITAGTRRLLVAEGLEKQDTIDAWENAYKHYVPMFRDEAESALPPHPQGSGFSVKGSSSKRATGSTKEVTNILAHVLMQREAAITRAEKNRVALSLYGQALSHPNPDFWTTIKPSMSAAKIGAELLAMGVDPMTAQVGMESAPTIRTVDATTGKVVDRPNPMYKSLPGAIPLKVNGEDRVLMLNVKTERGQRLAESLKNLDGLTQLDLAGSIIGKSTRWLAAVNTQFNPAFGLVNLVRDTLGGAIHLGNTELRGHSLEVLAKTPVAILGIARELASGGQTGKWQTLYRQFQADGGQTGFKENFRDPHDRAKAIEKELKSLGRSKLSPGRAAHFMLDLLDGFNTSLENAVRLSAYSAALDEGVSRAKAARLGRELTVDFNRKGRMGREVGPLYAFFNASVQGMERTMQAVNGPTGRKIILGGLSLGILQALMLAAAGYDDDEIPEFVKTRALIIPMMGDKKEFISIPYPLGLHVLPNTGRVLAELVLNGGKDMGKRSMDAIGEMAGAFNPLGGGNILTADGALRTMAPTLVDPLIELGFNRNFAGNKIEKEGYGGEADNRPGAARAKESTQRSTTGQVYLGISKALNAATGGTDYEKGLVSPTPERVRYLAQTVGGGVLRELEKTVNGASASSRGEKVPMSQIPVLGRFRGEVDADQVQTSRYYSASQKLEKLDNTLRTLDKADQLEAAEALEDKHPEAELIQDWKRARQALSKLNKLAVQTIGNPKEMAEIDADRLEEMRDLNEAVQDMERRTGKPTLAAKVREVVRPKREAVAAP